MEPYQSRQRIREEINAMEIASSRRRTLEKFIVIFIGSMKLEIAPIVVENTSDFAGHFQVGDRVGQIHLEPRIRRASAMVRARDTLEFSTKFVDLVPHLKRKFGFTGFYGDTNNRALLNHLIRKGAVKIEMPERDAMIAEQNFRKSTVRNPAYPSKYADSKANRVIIK